MTLFKDAKNVQCDGKRKHKTFTEAKDAAYEGNAPYRCPHCHFWHVGRTHASLTKRPRPVQHFGLND